MHRFCRLPYYDVLKLGFLFWLFLPKYKARVASLVSLASRDQLWRPTTGMPRAVRVVRAAAVHPLPRLNRLRSRCGPFQLLLQLRQR